MKTLSRIFKTITLVVLLAILLLYAMNVWADEPEIMTLHDATTYYNLKYYPKISIGSWGTVKISCPDGYKLEGKIYDRINNRKCKIKSETPNGFGYCLDSQILTDAELKCVKKN